MNLADQKLIQIPKEREILEKKRADDYLKGDITFRTPEELFRQIELHPREIHKLVRFRWGCHLKCKKCNGLYVDVGGMVSLLQISTAINDFKEHHAKCCEPDWSEVWTMHAAEIAHTFVNMTTARTHMGDTNWTDVTGAQILASNFVGNGKYLLMTTAQVKFTTTGTNQGWRMTHGSTPTVHDGSTMIWESGTFGGATQYAWFTVYTQPSTAEDIDMQHWNENAQTTVQTDTVSMISVRLDADLTEGTDWEYNFNGTNTTMSTTWSTSNNASITIASGDHAANDRHLIMALSTQTYNVVSQNYQARLRRTGEATENQPEGSREAESGAADERTLFFMTRTLTLGASDNTFEVQGHTDNASGTRTRYDSQVFSLNLDKFAVSNHKYNIAETGSFTTAAWGTTVETLTFDLSGEGAARDSVVIGYFVIDGELNFYSSLARMQIDGADAPTGFQNLPMWYWDNTDEIIMGFCHGLNLSAASHTIDLDASANVGAQLKGEDRCIAAFTMELAGGAPSAGFAHSQAAAIIG